MEALVYLKPLHAIGIHGVVFDPPTLEPELLPFVYNYAQYIYIPDIPGLTR